MTGPERRHDGRTLRLVAIGSSWGGMEALSKLLGSLPPDFKAPVAIVQHRGASPPGDTLERYLQDRIARPVVETEDKEPIRDGVVYLAPPDYHLLVDEGLLSLSLEAPVAYSRPSVDVLFESAADSYGPDMAALVLTGANDDGSRGVVAVRDAGGLVLAQDPLEAERTEMPAAAIATGVVDEVLTLQGLAARLAELDRQR